MWPGALPGAFHSNRIRRLRRMSGTQGEDPVSGGADELTSVPQYEALGKVLQECFEQAAVGKGRERHTDGGEAFTEQFICEGQRLVGIGFGLGQALKKVLEANRFAGSEKNEQAINELRGAINYLAATIIVLEEKTTNGSTPR